jgi:hypothetical protein
MPYTPPTTTQFQKCQLFTETTWGTPVTTSPYLLSATTLTPTVKTASQAFTPLGVTLPTFVSYGQKYTEIKFEGDATYTEIGKFVGSVKSDGASTLAPYTVEAGGLQIPGCAVTGWTLKGDTNSIKLSGTMMGKYPNVAAATSGGSQLAQTPMLADQVAITFGGTTVTGIFDWELSVDKLWDLVYFVGDNAPGGMVQRAAEASFNISFESNATNLAYLEDMETTTAIVVTITDGATNTKTFTFDAKLDEPQAFKDNQGVYGYGLKCHILNKATAAIAVA